MNRPIVILGVATLTFGSASAYLYHDLRETQAESTALQARIDKLEKEASPRAAATVAAPVPVPINPFGSASAAPPTPPAGATRTTPPLQTAGAVLPGLPWSQRLQPRVER